MGRNYKQITLAERCQITQLLAAGFKVREIAAALDRAPSTIARELKRNGSRTKGYEPSYAQQQARARRWSGSRLERDQGLREAVLTRLAQGWSPRRFTQLVLNTKAPNPSRGLPQPTVALQM